MGAKEPDREDSCPILDGRDQSMVVALDVKYDPAGLGNARFRVRRLDISGIDVTDELSYAPYSSKDDLMNDSSPSTSGDNVADDTFCLLSD
jgi:hypothetical protein